MQSSIDSPNPSFHRDRWLAIGLILFFVVIASMVCTAMAILSSLGAPTVDLRYEDLEAGNLLPMFLGRTFWNSYPMLPPDWQAVLSIPSAIWVSVTAAVVQFVLGRGFKTKGLFQVALIFLVGCLPMVMGRIYLSQPRSPYWVGCCLDFMLNSMLYSSLYCSFLVGCGQFRRTTRWWSLESQLQQLDIG